MRDLSFVPIRRKSGEIRKEEWWLGFNRLQYFRCSTYDYFDNSGDHNYPKVINEKPIPKDVLYQSYTDDGCKTIRKDQNNRDLTYFLAEDIHKIPDNVETSDWNKAVLSFLKALPKDTVVVMEWH